MAARTLRIRKLALFDPAVSVDGLFPLQLPRRHGARHRGGGILDAMVIVGRGLRNPGSNLPDPVVRAASRALPLTPPGKTMARLFPTVPPESRLALAGDGPASAWADVTRRDAILHRSEQPRLLRCPARSGWSPRCPTPASRYYRASATITSRGRTHTVTEALAGFLSPAPTG